MNLPERTRRFYFDHTSEFDERYEGYFTIKCRLSIRERHMLELEKTRLCGGFDNPTNALKGMAIILANLDIKIQDAPEWWKQNDNGRDLEDEEVLAKLYDKIADEEIAWKEELKKKTSKAVEETKAAEQSSEVSPKGNGQ